MSRRADVVFRQAIHQEAKDTPLHTCVPGTGFARDPLNFEIVQETVLNLTEPVLRPSELPTKYLTRQPESGYNLSLPSLSVQGSVTDADN